MNAIEIAEVKESCHLGLFEEHLIHHADLPGIGPIGGPVDFLISGVVGKFSARKVPDAPYLIVLEAMLAAKYGMIASVAQLFAQILTLQQMDTYLFFS